MKILAIILCIAFYTAFSSACLAQVSQTGYHDRPTGAVMLVVDGLGASYVYPEYAPYCINGSPLGKAILFNLTTSGARIMDIRAPVPETEHGHGVLVTGCSGVDPQALGTTIFEIARENGYLCLAVLERGDSMQMLQRQSGFLHMADNAIKGAEPTPGGRADLPEDMRQRLEAWYGRFDSYTTGEGVASYQGYNLWALEAVTDLVEHIDGRKFIMIVNVGAVDSAGQDLGPEGYLDVISALDAPIGRLEETCARKGVLLVVTADHGMSFVSQGSSRGGHASGKYAQRLESHRIPAVFMGPGLDDLSLGGVWSQADIAPTLLQIMGLPQNLSQADGKVMPLIIHESQIALNRSDANPARPWPVYGLSYKIVIGGSLILIIFLAGALIIIWIVRKDQ
ncbi:MAG TPA: alkaline phosphatase family protein [Methanotrichaceae archaeon]|nr:alkaline phosphatase family protein [Methanotrichaceae archaeon]